MDGKGYEKKSDFDWRMVALRMPWARNDFCCHKSHLTGSAAGASELFSIAARRMSADFAAHRGTQKAGEVCEELFQHVGVMNLATNVRTFFEPLLTGTKGWKTQCQGQG